MVGGRGGRKEEGGIFNFFVSFFRPFSNFVMNLGSHIEL